MKNLPCHVLKAKKRLLSHLKGKKFCHFLMILILSLPFCVSAKDFGVQGHTILIQEEDLLEFIQRKLILLEQNGEISSLQEALKEKTIRRIKEPVPVLGIQKATKHHKRTYDPTFEVKTEIKDHKGILLHPKGTKINPLHHRSFKGTWFFIEGRDKSQVEWALNQVSSLSLDNNLPKENSLYKIILVNGSPFELSEQHSYRFYFDQLGKLTEQFGIKKVPTRMFQEGDLLTLEEVPCL